MLKSIAEDIWVVDYDFFNFGIHFPTRMTVIRTAGGGLWLHSPVPIDDALAAALAELGTVKYLVAPNKFHHMFFAEALERYPDARRYAAPGLKSKRKDIEFHAELSSETPPELAGDIAQVYLRSIPAMGETVFFHRKSGTLITTDMFMNVHQATGMLSRFIYWAEGCYKKPAVPRLNRMFVKDKAVMAEDLGVMGSWPIQRLIMAHGEIVEDNAAEVVQRGIESFGAAPAATAQA